MSGKYKDWYNIEYSHPSEKAGNMGSVDLSRVRDLQVVQSIPSQSSESEDIMMVDDAHFQQAKKDELESWKRNSVYEEVKNVGQRCISTRLVCTLKDSPSGPVPKARLVARGFEDLHIKDIPKDSPTCATESLRTVLAVIAQEGWKACTMDIKTAFLQGSELSRRIYLRPPVEVNSQDRVWKLRKCVYGLVDASLSWYKRVCEVLQKTGAVISKVDPAIFYWLRSEGEVTGILASHVDDFIWGGSEYFTQMVIPDIRSSFLIGKEENEEFHFLGLDITQKDDIIVLDQQSYVNNLRQIEIDKTRRSQRHANLEIFQSKLGQLLWVACQTRPDILYDVCHLSTQVKTAKVEHLCEINKIIRKCKSENVMLKFQHLGKEESLRFVVFSDSSLGNLPDGASQGGSLVLLMGEDGRFNPLFWQSKRIRRVVRSSLAGETLALMDGVDNAIFISTLYAELTNGTRSAKTIPIDCIVDNQSLCDAVRSTKRVAEKRLRLEISGIKELISRHQVSHIKWIDTKRQIADCLTKNGASPLKLLEALEKGYWRT